MSALWHGRGARRLIAAALATLAFSLVFSAQKDQGVVRDEVVYMAHGSKYADWWLAFISGTDGMVSEQAITKHFGGPSPTSNNREHPPLMKTLFGLSHRLFYKSLRWTDELSAYRLPSVAMNALLIALIFLFCADLFGTGVGFIAALCTLFLPRALFHAGLACFDASVVTMWMAALIAYHRAVRWRGSFITAGVVFGLALATKHNALMLPAVVGVHYLYLAGYSQREALLEAPGLRAKFLALWRGFWRVRPSVILSLAVIGPLVFIALWPWLWFDTIDHIGDWVRFHLEHVHYNFEYLGENLNSSPYPWHVPIVTTLFTVPVAVLLAAVCGAGAHIRTLIDRRRDPDSPGDPSSAVILLLGLSMLVAMGPFFIGRAPIFGAEKHWAPAIPALCILAALGVTAAAELAIDRLRQLGVVRAERVRLAGILVSVALAGLVIGAAVSETAAAQPYALSHYNALAGGAPGGADLGMNRQFWGYSARGVLPFLDARASERDGPLLVYSHDASPTIGWYHRLGLLDPKVKDSGLEQSGVRKSRYAIVVHELHFNRHDYMIWDSYGTVQPVFVLRFQGVPIVSVYARPGSSSSAQ